MADGWRNRFMAPVYALAISFVLVVILGAALNDPTRIRFTIPGQNGSNEPANLKDTHVEVVTDKEDRRSLDEGPLNQSGEFTLLNPHRDIQICMKLPDDWSAADATVPGISGKTCWVRAAPGKDIEIKLRKG